ncbi:MAG: hypothetical protein WC852_05265 [Candidatus Nanoarchaeia archaeon]|jgi:predicted transcriptional regulator of viral defense system
MVNRLYLLKELEKYPVFTSKTIADITGKGKKYANLILFRLKKTGEITMLERDKYTSHKDPMIVATHMSWPSYISGWAALQYHHLTEQLPFCIEVITTRERKRRMLEFSFGRIRFIRTSSKNMFGYAKEQARGFEIFMAEKEKAIADCYAFNLVSENELKEIISRHRNELDVKLIQKYIMQTIRRTLIKKAEGFGRRMENA